MTEVPTKHPPDKTDTGNAGMSVTPIGLKTVAAVLSLTACLAMVGVVLFAPTWLREAYVVLLALFASIGALAATRLQPLPAAGRAWAILAAAMFAYTAGLLLLGSLGPDTAPDLAAPGNLLRLLIYPAFVVALYILLRHPEASESRLTLTLDAAIISLALGAVVVEGVFNGIAPIGATEDPWLLVFPLLDLAAFMVLVLIVAPTEGRVGGAYHALGAGFLMLAVADILHATHPALGGDAIGTYYAIWPLALVLFGFASSLSVSAKRVTALRGPWLYALGVGSGVVCLVVFLIDTVNDRDPLVMSISAAGLVLGMVRFVALARENSRLARDSDAIIAAAGEGIYRIDTDGRMTYLNPRAVEILGYEDEEELLGLGAHATLHHSYPNGSPYPASRCPVCQTVKRGETHRVIDEFYWRANGRGFPVAYTSAPVRRRGKVVGAVIVFDDLTQQRQLEERLQEHEDHDNLTGLVNRPRLEHELAAQLHYAERYHHAGALIAMDLDAFSLVNDSAGHRRGDETLCEVASILREEAGPIDVPARIGGDEFALLLREASEDEAVAAARRLIGNIGERTGMPLTASVGLAPFDGYRQRSASELLIWADSALEQAKAGGGGVVVTAEPEMVGRLTSVERIRRALAEQRFALCAQPIVDVRSSKLIREELLVRMLDEEGELVPPGDFLPTAERYGLITEIDLMVIKRAAAMARQGRKLAVNLSARSISDHRTIELIEAAIDGGVAPDRLSFEVTETAAVSNMPQARSFATRLHELGCCVALDDFGTGFSSFAYLKNIPVQIFKIDIDFIRELPRSAADRRLVEVMVNIAAGFGQKVVAEGVEDAATMEIIRDLGVDYAQGYYVGEPALCEPAPVSRPAEAAQLVHSP